MSSNHSEWSTMINGKVLDFNSSVAEIHIPDDSIGWVYSGFKYFWKDIRVLFPDATIPKSLTDVNKERNVLILRGKHEYVTFSQSWWNNHMRNLRKRRMKAGKPTQFKVEFCNSMGVKFEPKEKTPETQSSNMYDVLLEDPLCSQTPTMKKLKELKKGWGSFDVTSSWC